MSVVHALESNTLNLSIAIQFKANVRTCVSTNPFGKIRKGK